MRVARVACVWLSLAWLCASCVTPVLASGTSARELQQVLTMPQIVTSTEQLEMACRIDSLSALLGPKGREGVVCVLAASVVGQFEELRYTVNITKDVVEKMTMQIVIEPWDGDVAMCDPGLSTQCMP